MITPNANGKELPLVLLVDDEPDLLEIMGIELKYHGFDVITAESGEQALNVMRERRPSVVLSDIRMPHGDGIFLLKHMVSEQANPPPVIFISGYSDLDEAVAFDQGACGYHHKPVDMGSMVETLRHVLLPRRERWSVAPKTIPAQELKLVLPPFRKAKDKGLLSLGQGGFYVACKALAENELVAFDITVGTSDRLVGVGVVRWARENGAGEGPPGCGIEILHLDAGSQDFLESALQVHPNHAYIPLR